MVRVKTVDTREGRKHHHLRLNWPRSADEILLGPASPSGKILSVKLSLSLLLELQDSHLERSITGGLHALLRALLLGDVLVLHDRIDTLSYDFVHEHVIRSLARFASLLPQHGFLPLLRFQHSGFLPCRAHRERFMLDRLDLRPPLLLTLRRQLAVVVAAVMVVPLRRR